MKLNFDFNKFFKTTHPFKRMTTNGYLFGVLSGFAYAFELNVFLVRFLFVMLALGIHSLVIVYLVFAFLADKWGVEPANYHDLTK